MMYALATIVCASLFAQFYKVAERRKCDVYAVNLGIYVGAIVPLVGFFWCTKPIHFEAPIVALGIFGGSAGFVAALLFFTATKVGKLAVGWVIINLSIIIPVIAAFIAWDEPVTIRKLAGLFCAGVAIILLGMDQKQGEVEKCG